LRNDCLRIVAALEQLIDHVPNRARSIATEVAAAAVFDQQGEIVFLCLPLRCTRLGTLIVPTIGLFLFLVGLLGRFQFNKQSVDQPINITELTNVTNLLAAYCDVAFRNAVKLTGNAVGDIEFAVDFRPGTATYNANTFLARSNLAIGI
jgi:hypothetical protein